MASTPTGILVVPPIHTHHRRVLEKLDRAAFDTMLRAHYLRTMKELNTHDIKVCAQTHRYAYDLVVFVLVDYMFSFTTPMALTCQASLLTSQHALRGFGLHTEEPVLWIIICGRSESQNQTIN